MPSRIHIYLPHIFHRCPSLSFIFHTRHSLLHNLYFHSHPSPTFAYFTGALLRMSQTPSYWMYIQRHPSTECIFRDTLLQNSHFTDTLLSAKFLCFFYRHPTTEFACHWRLFSHRSFHILSLTLFSRFAFHRGPSARFIFYRRFSPHFADANHTNNVHRRPPPEVTFPRRPSAEFTDAQQRVLISQTHISVSYTHLTLPTRLIV